MMSSTYHERTLIAFTASDSRVTVYIKQSDETREYALKTMRADGRKEFLLKSHSLSTILREFAETVAQHSNSFTTWRQL
jgi:hypothetical protein